MRTPFLRRVVALAALVSAIVGGITVGPASANGVGGGEGAPQIGHVWLIMLENHSYPENFGEVAQNRGGMEYLAKTLPSKGALLSQYYGIAHPSNANYTALVSGQPPNVGFLSESCTKNLLFCTGTQFNCAYYTNFNLTSFVAGDVGVGQGCVYPTNVPDIGTELRNAGRTVKAYQEDMPKPCDHPELGAYDEAAAAGDPGYQTGNNPFLYFHAWIDNPKLCASDDVPLNHSTFEPLVSDLKSVATTPNLSWIGLNLCDDGHDYCPFSDKRSDPSFFKDAHACAGGIEPSQKCNQQSSRFLSELIPKITASPAYNKDGLIVIMWDEANFYTTSPYTDYSACCNEPNQPGASGLAGVTGQINLGLAKINITPGATQLLGHFGDTTTGFLDFIRRLVVNDNFTGQPGGGNSGAIMLSPFIKGGTASNVPYNHYSLLATIQKIFGVPRTGNAADPMLVTIGSDVSGAFPNNSGRAP